MNQWVGREIKTSRFHGPVSLEASKSKGDLKYHPSVAVCPNLSICMEEIGCRQRLICKAQQIFLLDAVQGMT